MFNSTCFPISKCRKTGYFGGSTHFADLRRPGGRAIRIIVGSGKPGSPGSASPFVSVGIVNWLTPKSRRQLACLLTRQRFAGVAPRPVKSKSGHHRKPGYLPANLPREHRAEVGEVPARYAFAKTSRSDSAPTLSRPARRPATP